MAEILSAYLGQQAAEAFVYGSSDCSTFVVGWLDLLTGEDAMKHWAGKFHDKWSCWNFIAANGGFRDIAGAFFMKHYGIEETQPAVGNVVLTKLNDLEAMGLRVSLDGDIALRTERGMLVTKRAEVLCEWGLPCLPS